MATGAQDAQQRFNSAGQLSEAMLRHLKQHAGLEGALQAQRCDSAKPVGAASPAKSNCCVCTMQSITIRADLILKPVCVS